MTDDQKLNPEQLDDVAGGTFMAADGQGTHSQDKTEFYEMHNCKGKCKRKTVFKMYSGCRGVCTECGWVLQ